MKIHCENGMGREVNPHLLHITPSFDWTDFERTVQSFPCYLDGKPFMGEGDFEGEIKYQGMCQIADNDYGYWFFLTYNSDALTPEEWEMQGYKIRPVIAITPPVEANQTGREKLSNKILAEYGFEAIPHFTILNSTQLSIGRDRYFSIGCAGSPNEMMWLTSQTDDVVTDLVCLHNWDYDGWLTIEKIQAIYLAITGSPLNPLTR